VAWYISEEAIAATKKIMHARDDQRRRDVVDARASQTAAAEARQANASVLTNADVIGMVRARLSEKIIVTKIRTAKCHFDTTPNALIQLKNAGTSDAVVLVLTEARCVE
jgi:hypothetical protein